MTQKEKSIGLLVAYCIMTVAMTVGAAICLNKFEWYAQLAIYVVVWGSQIIGLIFYFIHKKALFRLMFTFQVTITVIMAFFITMNLLGIMESLSDFNILVEKIRGTGGWGILVFMLLQIVQVLFLPLPALVMNLVGVALYGPTTAFILGSISVVIGSMIAFAVGKIFGTKVVNWIVGNEEDVKKYSKIIGGKGKFILILMLLFPFFPDDIICMVAGLTSISYSWFFLIVMLTRPINVAVCCYFGSGEIIPFHGWGLIVWAALFVAIVVAFLLLSKYKQNIVRFFKKIFHLRLTKSDRTPTKPASVESEFVGKAPELQQTTAVNVSVTELAPDTKVAKDCPRVKKKKIKILRKYHLGDPLD